MHAFGQLELDFEVPAEAVVREVVAALELGVVGASARDQRGMVHSAGKNFQVHISVVANLAGRPGKGEAQYWADPLSMGAKQHHLR